MGVLEACGITKVFPGVKALDDVSLQVEKGRIHCIIGENGAGKSTLIKIFTGIYACDEGEVRINGVPASITDKKSKKLFSGIAYVPQELDLFSEMSVAENLFIPFKLNGLRCIVSKSKLQTMAVPWLERFKIRAGPGELVKNISVSERQMLQIARSMTDDDSEILILDEPTTSLTSTEAERLFDVLKELKSRGKAVIFISHKLEEIFAIGDDITVLRNGKKVASSSARDVDIPWVIARMIGNEISQEETYRPEKPQAEVLMEVSGFSGAKFSNISFTLHKGEILGFSGLVGSGRTEIMQAIFGCLPVWSGAVKIEGKPWKFGDTSYSVRHGFIYLPEERKQQGILPKLSVKHNITAPLLERLRDGLFIAEKKETAAAYGVVNTYNIKTASLDQLIQNLSGGNQQKVIIGRSMFIHPKILVFDEPTKGIDIGSKVEIYRLMKKLAEEEQIGIILISSEMNELLKCSNRIIAVYFGSKAGESAAPFDKTKILNEIMGIKRSDPE
ncbi:MAG: sugar ABC transporter ATP-binding protein [Spirochaetaceae bacterium]|jgi:ribose transport system ATP-binding protein|nr:sugar ABC transporter ATP-binding protein [Spirochaetaceae bacterium]